MPRYEHFDEGDPCWVELATPDPLGSASFYASVLGWSLRDMGPESGHYHLISAGPLPDGRPATVGGLGAAEPGERSSWIVYFNAPDLDAVRERALQAGASSVAGPEAVMEQGSMALLSDPQGVTFGLWQPAGRRGFDAWGEPATTAWFEFHTTRLQAATGFYAAVTGFESHPMVDSPEFRYTQFGPQPGGVDARFGALEASTDSPRQHGADAPPDSEWLVYFITDSVDAAAARAASLGGQVRGAPADSPFGRMTTLVDPFGASFCLIEAREGDAA
ncbi:VOC family protein [Pseudoclavibacter sp. VKM Ac-2867]|uniref:VOC family protein n=1 Tax=Pseudoclavibacter sp. VKM Ac-2867 TaxID=2783829 RepID=UPI00188CDCC4|nr:VOC family protein [Pseudoclavibacter sp. VKM Ac-2867]MBF4459899.1 VOC family protein [Pseudoclavibacter sp. VKM Ac-2867]